MALDIQTTHHIADIGEADWDASGECQPFSSYRWNQYGERVMQDSTPFYIVIRERERPVARASFWLVRDEPLPVRSPVVRWGLRSYLRLHPLLICHAPLAETGGMVLPDSPLRRPALEAILSTARTFAREKRASFIICDYLSAQQSAPAEWPAGWRPVQMNEPSTCLPMAWSSFDDYLASLSKSVRKDYRRQANQAGRLNLILSAESAVSNLDEAIPLIHAVERKHGSVAAKPWIRAMLEHAHKVPSTWITARLPDDQGGRLVGCGLLLADQGVYVATLLGMDYTVSYVYFQLFYTAIRQVIQQGGRVLRAGSGAYAIKQRLGFTTENNNFLCFYDKSGLLGRIAQWMDV